MKSVFRNTLLVMLFCFFLAPVSALAADIDLVYLTTTQDYSESTIGVLNTQTEAAYSERVTGLGGDVAAFEIEIDGEKRVLVRSYTFGGSQDDLIRVYDPMDWSEPVVPAFRAGQNIRDAITSGDILYLANYDTATVTAHDINNDFGVVDSCDLSGELPLVFYSTYVQDMHIEDGSLFVLLQSFNQAWPPMFQNGAVYELNGDLDIISSVDVGKNSFSLGSYGGYLFVSNFGGAQNVTSSDIDTSIQRIEIDTFPTSSELVLTSEDLGTNMSFVNMAISGPDSAQPGTMLISVLDNSVPFPGAYDLYLSSGNITSNFTINDFESIPAWVNMVKYDKYKDLFWVNQSQNKFQSYETDGTLISEFTENDLEGLPVAVLPIEGGSNFNGDSGSSGGGSGGCNVAGAGMGYLLLLLPLLGLAWRRSR